jgi:hypothetical protein
VRLRAYRYTIATAHCWVLVALQPAPISDPPVVPPVLLVFGISSDPPAVPSGPLGVFWIPRVPSGPSGVPPGPPACPPVPLPLVSRGSYSRKFSSII